MNDAFILGKKIGSLMISKETSIEEARYSKLGEEIHFSEKKKHGGEKENFPTNRLSKIQ